MTNSTTPPIDITDTLPQHWKYVSEGGATIVFSYIGESSDFTGTVLRLRKTTALPARGHTQTFVAAEVQGVSEFLTESNCKEEPDDPMIEFQHNIMERLIPPEHLPRLMPVRVERSWLQTLADLRNSDRPHNRRQKDHIDVARTKAVIATDLVGGDCLVIEIKPKWAFLPSAAHLSPATLPIKTKTCRFCMHSHYRSQTDNAVLLSYCPLDLFSSNEIRIKKAIRSLWDGWLISEGSANNLRVFVHGNMIRPTDEISLTPLMKSLSADDINLDLSALRERFISTITPPLLNTQVLRTLCKLQRTLDALDIEGLSRLWALSHSRIPVEMPSTIDDPIENLPALGSNSVEPSIADWSTFVDEYLVSHASLDHTKPHISNLRYYLLAYLLSATFKDCSIMVRVNQGQNSGAAKDASRDSVTVIDLDPKSIQRLSKWEKLDREITESYAGVEGRNCMDEWKHQD